ncbi:MAG: hemolysin family protein [Oscillospiraceae bacterium]|jgi:putative hemolysin|nr:hemolysin family protein [Oscillospiraceae bacterium]
MDADPAGLILQILLLFVLIGVNAFFVMSEIAVITLNDNKIDRLAADGNKKAHAVQKLTENFSRFLSTVQIGVTLTGFLTSASASMTFADILVNALSHTFLYDLVGKAVLHGVAVVIITLVVSYITLVLGELVPKKIAIQNAEKVAYAVSGILLGFSKAVSPFVKILTLSTNGLVRLFGFDPNADEEAVTEEEIRMMVDVGEEKGVIESDQREMIDNIFEFDDMTAADAMTHRTDMASVSAESQPMDVVSISVEEGHSRIPVYKGNPDNIVGIVYIKDLLPYVGTALPEHVSIRDFMRKAYYVPESKPCGALFAEMKQKHLQMAVVVDEFGGTAGIITMEDVLEAIVGDIQDEYDDEGEEVTKIDESTFTVDGVTYIDELEELTGMRLPEGDYDTVGGFVLAQLGYLPEDGHMDVAEHKNLRFTVLNVEDRRIGRVKIEILPGGAETVGD